MRFHRMKKKMCKFDHPLDFDPTLVMSRGIHRSRAISAVITRLIDGSDLMDIMWPISQSHFHVSYLCSLK